MGWGSTKLSKLDRFLVSPSLLRDWPAISVVALERTFTDHCPILLKSVTNDFRPTPFRFFDHWMEADSFNEMVKNVWPNFPKANNPWVTLKNKLKLLKHEIKSWRSTMLPNDVDLARNLMADWELKAESHDLGPEDSAAFQKARADYFQAAKFQALSLKQKSRVKWAVEGDENSSYFHGIVCGRLKKNSIHGL